MGGSLKEEEKCTQTSTWMANAMHFSRIVVGSQNNDALMTSKALDSMLLSHSGVRCDTLTNARMVCRPPSYSQRLPREQPRGPSDTPSTTAYPVHSTTIATSRYTNHS